MKFHVWKLAALLLILSGSIASAQRQRDPQSPPDQKPANTIPLEQPTPPSGEVETLKIDTNLVTVPVIASSRTGQYITDLRKEEFKLAEDGVAQEIAFLATTNVPFYVVLMLDTSASTQEKLGEIKRAAITFLSQLGPRDRVKIISFDNELRDLSEFTADKAILRSAIERTRSGQGTRVYDAMQMALDALRPIQQRKAIVVFTDGMDWHSERSTFEGTVHELDEAGAIVYPIRFDTRVETERLARKQAEEQNGVALPTSSILRAPTSSTPTTFPSDDPSPVPKMKREPLPIPPLAQILGRGRDPNPQQRPPTDPFPDSGGSTSSRTNPRPGTVNRPAQTDSISGMMDNLYLTADSYLAAIAERSGGQVYRADTVANLPQAFAAIADELRTQYLLGYYPSNPNQDGSYRKIQVKTSRRDIAVRARPGYRARRG
jgi:VWFA-related protein